LSEPTIDYGFQRLMKLVPRHPGDPERLPKVCHCVYVLACVCVVCVLCVCVYVCVLCVCVCVRTYVSEKKCLLMNIRIHYCIV
ncbi:hypothetical protein HELRODRAFT_78894, partial [Helobdella robusta]|uniref:Transcription factor COE helix-loop-helix domain-containing protein n=1 Tax=Helobdella robusta TaxID=6412 RepID=T1G3H0_HELRO